MAFEAGHEKRGGRKPGTPNKISREARELARRLLSGPEYWNGLKTRLAQGQAPRVELHLWELAYGKPRMELDEAPDGSDPSPDLGQLLEGLREDSDMPRGVEGHDGDEGGIQGR
jgi:hypothetical protein